MFKNALNLAWRKVRDQKDGYAQKLKETNSSLDTEGLEMPDPTPMAPPIGYQKTPHVYDMLRAMVQNEISRKAAEQDYETFEESDDFEVDDNDDYPITSQYENDQDPPISHMVAEGKRAIAEKTARQSSKSPLAAKTGADPKEAPDGLPDPSMPSVPKV